MPPFVVPTSGSEFLTPIRLVLVPLNCFYCGNATEEEVREYRIYYLFGLFHCQNHAQDAEQDCKRYMRREGIVRIQDALSHGVLGPFLQSLGTSIPVLRSSGDVETGWFLSQIDHCPLLRRSQTLGCWGIQLTNGVSEKFIPFEQFRDNRIAPFLSNEVLQALPAVESLLQEGFYPEEF